MFITFGIHEKYSPTSLDTLVAGHQRGHCGFGRRLRRAGRTLLQPDFGAQLPVKPMYYIHDEDAVHFRITVHQGVNSTGVERVANLKEAASDIAKAESKRLGWEKWQLDYISEHEQGWMHVVVAEVTRVKYIAPSFPQSGGNPYKISSPEKSGGIMRTRQAFAFFQNVREPVARPFPQPVNRAECEIRRPPAVCANHFRAAPDIVQHPRGQPRVIRIPPHLARMTRQRRDKVGDIRDIRLDEQVRLGHLSPKFRLDNETFKINRQIYQRVQHQKMHADVRRMPVGFVRQKNRARPILRQNPGNRPDRRLPARRIFIARFQIDVLQPSPDQGKT